MRNAVEKKGTPTPEDGIAAAVSGQNAPARTRRTDARRGVSEKITVKKLEGGKEGEVVSTGWAINMSRSGIRAILEERILAGVDYAVTVGEDGTTQLTRRARVVWLQEEHDGFVAGLEFSSQSGLHKAAAPHDGKADGHDEKIEDASDEKKDGEEI